MVAMLPARENGSNGLEYRASAANPSDANAADKLGGVSIHLSIGASDSRSNRRTSSDTARASTLNAGADLSLAAHGAGNDSNDSNDSDLIVQGSNLNAGRIGRAHV